MSSNSDSDSSQASDTQMPITKSYRMMPSNGISRWNFSWAGREITYVRQPDNTFEIVETDLSDLIFVGEGISASTRNPRDVLPVQMENIGPLEEVDMQFENERLFYWYHNMTMVFPSGTRIQITLTSIDQSELSACVSYINL